jgi:hypothetical protein
LFYRLCKANCNAYHLVHIISSYAMLSCFCILCRNIFPFPTTFVNSFILIKR